MASEIKLIAQPRNGGGNPQTFDYKPGGKHTAEAGNFYKISVDGKEELPAGTKIVRKGNSIVFDFPDGTHFTIDDWCGVSDSRLTELVNGEAYSVSDGAYVPAKDIDSGTCMIWADAGQAGAVLGDSSAAPVTTATAPPAAGDDHATAGIVAAILGVGALAVAASGGGGGGGGGGSSGPGKPTVDLADASDTGLSATDNLTKTASPTMQGKADAGATVKLFVDGGTTPIATVVADQNGNWTFPIDSQGPLTEGNHTFTATQTTSGGTGPASDPLTIYVDLTPPAIAFNGNDQSEDFAPILLDSTLLQGTDDHSAVANLRVTSAKIVSADGTFVFSDDNDPTNDHMQIVQNDDGTLQLQLTSAGANQMGSIVAQVELQDEAGNATTKSITFNVVTPNSDAPVNVAPARLNDQQVFQPVNKASGLDIQVADPDEATGPDTFKIASVELKATDGTLALSSPPSGADPAVVTGGGSGTLTLTGSQASINAALANLVWSDTLGTVRDVTLTMTSTDKQGLTDIDTIIIPMVIGTGGALTGGNGGVLPASELFSGSNAETINASVSHSSSLSSLIGDPHDPALNLA